MRALATAIIADAALVCGLPAQAIFNELENARREKIFLPERRLEMAFLDETYTRQGWRVALLKVDEPGVCRTRWAKYRCVLPVRVLVRDTDQQTLDAFCRAFLLKLPGKTRDAAGNPVRVTANKASRQGYTFASIRIEEQPTQALHLSFTGIVHKDEDTNFITNLNIQPYYQATLLSGD